MYSVKKLSIALTLILFACVSCNPKDPAGDSLRLDRSSIVFETDLDAQEEVAVECNGAWSARSNKYWLTVLPASGNGNGSFTLSVSVNDDNMERSGTVEVTSGNVKKSITVRQSATVNLSLSKDQITMRNDISGGDTQILTVETDAAWTLEIDPSETSWLDVSPMSGYGQTQVAVHANVSAAERSCELIVTAGTRRVTCPVSQPGSGLAYFFGSSEVINLCDKAGSTLEYYRMFRFTSAFDWTATTSEPWINIENTTSPSGSRLMKVWSSSENNTGADRTGTITFTPAPSSGGGAPKVITVVQGHVGNYWNDGDVIVLNRHTKGKGVPVIVIGDGFDREDLKKGGTWEHNGVCKVYRDPNNIGGWWEKYGSFMAQRFMENEVVCDMLDYIDVFVLVSESPERGFTPKPDKHLKLNGVDINYPAVRNKYKNANRDEIGVYDAGRTGVKKEYKNMRDNLGYTTATTHSDVEINGGSNIVRVMFMTNGWYPGNASNPMCRGGLHEPDFDYWASHEFTGHVLCDIPDLYGSGTSIPSNQFLTDRTNEHNKGFSWYCSWNPAIVGKTDAEKTALRGVKPSATEVVWKDFMTDPFYQQDWSGAPTYNNSHKIGIYDTCFGMNYRTFVWRPGNQTCMDQWTLGFDLGCRLQIWNKILQRAGDPDYNNIEKFKIFDKNRTKVDCRLSSPTGPTPAKASGFTVTNYNNKGQLTQSGVKDRFWRALWPADNWDNM
ncbi:MAG: BACON domain-containing protein [Rikenellaceae bacterium]|jgi:hypothetical protein|nr:BACON domain-containing protein [Rikenellaceae bacterium]